MSTATAVDATPPAGKGKKKLIIIVAAALLLALIAGGAVVFLLKKQSAAAKSAEADADGKAAPVAKADKPAAKAPPVFVPLDPFTVNLADRDAERYAQVGMTLEIEEAKLADQIKLFMPAIRNNILLAIADKTAGELMERDGKRRLALEVRRETSRALGYDVPDARDPVPSGKGDAGPGGRNRADPYADLPVKAVHFNNFIIQ